MIVLYNTKYNTKNILKDHFDENNIDHIYVQDERISDVEINKQILYLQKENKDLKMIVIIPNLLELNIITKFKEMGSNPSYFNRYDELKEIIINDDKIYNEYDKWFLKEILLFMNLKLKHITLEDYNTFKFQNRYLMLVKEHKINDCNDAINNFINSDKIIKREESKKENRQILKIKRKIMLSLTKNDLINILHHPIIKKLNGIDIYSLKREMAKDIYSNFYDQDFFDYLKDKRVVIVGPAPYLEGLKKGKEFDEYDIVVRVNRGLGLINAKGDYGSRCDILYHCMSEHKENGGNVILDELRKHKVKYFRAGYPPLNAYERSSFKTRGTIVDYNQFKHKFLRLDPIKFSFVDKDYYLKLEDDMRTRPNTGIIAILDLLQSELKELYITGFTFFKDGYNKNYRDSIDGVKIGDDHGASLVKKRLDMHGSHKQENIIHYMKDILLENERVRMDQQVISAMTS